MVVNVNSAASQLRCLHRLAWPDSLLLWKDIKFRALIAKPSKQSAFSIYTDAYLPLLNVMTNSHCAGDEV